MAKRWGVGLASQCLHWGRRLIVTPDAHSDASPFSAELSVHWSLMERHRTGGPMSAHTLKTHLMLQTRGQCQNESQKAVIIDMIRSVGEIASKIWPVI